MPNVSGESVFASLAPAVMYRRRQGVPDGAGRRNPTTGSNSDDSAAADAPATTRRRRNRLGNTRHQPRPAARGGGPADLDDVDALARTARPTTTPSTRLTPPPMQKPLPTPRPPTKPMPRTLARDAEDSAAEGDADGPRPSSSPTRRPPLSRRTPPTWRRSPQTPPTPGRRGGFGHRRRGRCRLECRCRSRRRGRRQALCGAEVGRDWSRTKLNRTRLLHRTRRRPPRDEAPP